jgi:hypothetical protein
MSPIRTALGLACAAALALTAAPACTYRAIPRTARAEPHAPRTVPGPPDHAPAHGHRKKRPQPLLAFDAGLGVWVAVEVPGLYHLHGLWYRQRGSLWQTSPDAEGPWIAVPADELPRGLRAKHSLGERRVPASRAR